MRCSSLDKSIVVVSWIWINALLASCQSATRPGAEVVIGVDDAVAVLALERVDDDDGTDDGLATSDAPALDRGQACDVATLRRDLIAHYDKDRDGMLDTDELGALRRDFGGRTKGGKPRQLVRLERIKLMRWVYDADADRRLGSDEWQTLRDDLDVRCLNDRQHEGERRDDRAARRARAFARSDLDHNGRLSARELAAARDTSRKRIATYLRTLVDRFDTDGNGLLNAHERAALREYQRSVVRGERVAPLPEHATRPTDAGGDASPGP